MKVTLDVSDIQKDIDALKGRSDYSGQHYAALLRIVLSPSVFDITDDALNVAITSLRKSELNPSYPKIAALLQELAPISTPSF